MLRRYSHNRYRVVRTLCVMVVQATFGFSVPVLLGMFRQPEYYLSYFWPLKIDAFTPTTSSATRRPSCSGASSARWCSCR